MGRSVSPPDAGGRRFGGALARLALGLALIFVAGSALAQSAATQGAAARNPDKLVVEANELVYDKDHNTVSAVGGVELYYQHRVLQADRVVYNRTTKRLYAEGRAKLTDEKGNITYAKRFDLTDDFAAGFAEGVASVSLDRTRFTSPRVERSAGAVTVFNSGVYTACEPCKLHPERPPLWQVRAAKIIENQQTHVVYYEDAWLEVAGVPIAYIPYFSAPDPTVTRQSGLLAPTFTSGSYVGTGFSVPYFINLAPSYDLTLNPTYFSSQGPFLDADWRQRLETGQYNIRVNGIDQQDVGVFPPYPYDSGNRRWRGSVESKGEFYLNDKWKWGWDVTAMSDPFYLNDYKIRTVDTTQYYLQDVISSVYLRGQADRGFFDLSGYRFESTAAAADQRQQPFAGVLDYNKTIALSPDATGGIGGEIKIDLNATNIARQEAVYQSTMANTVDQVYQLYNVCGIGGTVVGGYKKPGTYSTTSPSVGSQGSYSPNNNCLLTGIAGDYARVSEQVSWQRKFIDPLGETWTPFVFARLDGETTALNAVGTYTYDGGSSIYNSSQTNYFGGQESAATGRAMTGVGLEYRYPLISTSAFGQQIFEPIAQLIVRPNEVIPKLQPNEDSQSLVFDETNLFAWDKYSGYDRIEGGTRLNYGAQYTANFANGGHANIVGGESIALAGRNSYTIADAANTGLESGLDKRFSNYVIGETVAPFSSNFSLTSKQQFDSSDFALTRLDVIASASYGGFSTGVDFGRYAAQPELGYIFQREGVQTNASYKLTKDWTVDASVLLDMSRHYYDQVGQSTPRFYAPSYGFGLTYGDTCTTLKVRYTTSNSDPVFLNNVYQPTVRDQTFLVQLTLRTLAEVGGTFSAQ
jgi:LPS-assembly protein